MKLNGWHRIGICLSVAYLLFVHIFIFIDSKNPPRSSSNDPFMPTINTVFFEWGTSSSPGEVREKELRLKKGYSAEHKLTAEEFLETLPDQWIRSFRLNSYLVIR